MKYCVYTRCFYENEYLDYFIKHYLDIGFNKIIILHSGGSEYKLHEKYKNLVDIYYVLNEGNVLLSKYDYLIKESDFDWFLVVDNDEFLILNNEYKTINDYVENKLLLNNNINQFYFRWGMIEKYDIENNNNFSYILQNYKIFSNPHIKSMFKKQDFMNISQHYSNFQNLTIYFENNITNKNNALHTINFNSYQEHILIHIHTRSINNLIIKSLYTKLERKYINLKNEFIEFINSYAHLSNNTILDIFKKFIGMKAILPFEHAKGNVINMSEYNIIYSKFHNCELINLNENIEILNFLKNNNINVDKYFSFIDMLSNKIIDDKTFII